MIEGLKLGIIFAIIVEGFHFLLTLYLTKNIEFKNKTLNRMKPLLFFFVILLILYIIFSGFFIIHTNESAVLTKFTGEKKVISDVGIKYSFLGKSEIVNLQKQMIKFPEISDDNYEMITSDNKPISLHSFLHYQIKDVNLYAIDNKDSENKISVALASETKKVFQEKDYYYIFKNLDMIKEQMKNDLSKITEKYGIEIIDVDIQLADTYDVKTAKAKAESQKIESASLKDSYTSEAEALKIKYNSLEDKDFIKYMEFIQAIKEGKIQTILIPQNTISSFNINSS